MRLTEIKLAGFKTFVDPTRIPVPGNIVGIVGPNGCGKSNVIDAIRWVLGESKASALRGDSIQDVIFNGSIERRPVARASVELVFDNSSGRAQGQWSQYAEISVKRVLQRDGDSSYFLNNLRVRKKDVTDLFLGTGLGGRGYAIVEQGMISRIIEANPVELRVFLEEAAGISRYRERRRETEIRLRDTSENLLRVSDICRELTEQIERLEAQAARAKTFLELKKARDLAQNRLWLAKRNLASRQREKLAAEVREIDTSLEAEIAKLRSLERQSESLAQSREEASSSMEVAQAEMYQARADVAQLEQEISHLKKLHESARQNIEKTRLEIERLEEEKRHFDEVRQKWTDSSNGALAALSVLTDELEKEEGKLPALDERVKEAKRAFLEKMQLLQTIERDEKAEQVNFNHFSRIISQLDKRIEEISREEKLLPLPDPNDLPAAEAELSVLEQEVTRLKTAIAEKEKSLHGVETGIQDASQHLLEKQKEHSGIEARLRALQEIQRKLETGGLAEWLKKNRLEGFPRLWQLISIAKEWEIALESVLGEKLHAIFAPELSLYETPPASAVLLAAGEHVEPEARKSLFSLIEYSEPGIGAALHSWTKNHIPAGSIIEAFARRHELPEGDAFVTVEGHIVEKSCIRWHAPDQKLHGLMERKNEIARLEKELPELSLVLESVREALAGKRESLAKDRQELLQLRPRLADVEKKARAAEVRKMQLLQTIERASERRERIAQEKEKRQEELRAAKQTGDESRLKLSAFEAEKQKRKEAFAAAESAAARSEENFERQRKVVYDKSRALQEGKIAASDFSYKIQEAAEKIKYLLENIAERHAAIEEAEREIPSLDSSSHSQKLQLALEQLAKREEALLFARKQSEEVAQGARECEVERQKTQKRIEPMREKLNATRLQEREAAINEAQYDEKLQGVDASISGEPEKIPVLQAAVGRYEQEIEALGAVNLAAFEELDSAAQRKDYLDSQHRDLFEAVEMLEDAIRRIDRETRARLKATYDEVNGHFGQLFSLIFGGGVASLVLKGEEIIDSGVEIMAHPPGKKNASIHLLSGGEKALTALSLVFSLFRLSPSPFCLLDEVDAPLDDSNTLRFCDMVREMAQNTQFIFISHNKISMEMAQQLIGVTMQEKGVSRIVAVDVEEAARSA